MKVALVHDYLYTYGGAERVLEALHKIWPEAPVYTAWVDWQWLKTHKPEWQNWQIIASWFDKLPFKKQLCSALRFLAPKIWSSFSIDAQVVISSSAWYISKGVSLNKKGNALHVCYCHTPPRYLYGYTTANDFKKHWLTRAYAIIVNPFMRYYDFKSSQAVDFFICNSREVRQRIAKFYRRQAKIIYPAINIKSVGQSVMQKASNKNDYLLMVNRLVKPKNVDLAIKACQLERLKLKVVGTGPDEKRLKEISGNDKNIEFLGYVDDIKLAKLYAGCRGVLYLAEQEDFGITPIEAMSFGKPVLALKSGGTQETIINNKTGLFTKKNLSQIRNDLQRFIKYKFKSNDCMNQAKKFSQERFVKEIKQIIQQQFAFKNKSY